MFARASVLLLRSCQPHLAARAAVTALLLRQRSGRHRGIHDCSSTEGGTDRSAHPSAEDLIQGVGVLEAYAKLEDENDDAVFDLALRLLQRVQGPTCSAAVRDICGHEHRHRSRLAHALAACMAWFYHQEHALAAQAPGKAGD